MNFMHHLWSKVSNQDIQKFQIYLIKSEWSQKFFDGKIFGKAISGLFHVYFKIKMFIRPWWQLDRD